MSAILQNNLLSYIELLHYIHIHMSTIVTVMRFCAVFMLQCIVMVLPTSLDCPSLIAHCHGVVHISGLSIIDCPLSWCCPHLWIVHP
jgi:hypothetical protein